MQLNLIHGDCLEQMKILPDKSVDLFLCDLPYGCLTGGGGQEKQRRRFQNGKDTGTLIKQTDGVIAGCGWDIKINLDLFWEQVERLMKNDHTPIIHFCNMRFGMDLYTSNPDWFRYDLVWSKSNAVGFLSANKKPMSSHENIFVFSKKGANYYRKDIVGDFPSGGMPNTGTTVAGKRCVKSVIEVANKKGRGNHPTQKPADLYKWLIERYSKEGDTILDPTAGSFTSCFTARELGRNAIGIEKDDKFYQKAKDIAEK